MNLAVGGIGLAVALAVGLPAASRPFVVASGLTHTAYDALPIVTDRSGDLGRVFLAERLTLGRIVACTIIAGDAAMIGHG